MKKRSEKYLSRRKSGSVPLLIKRHGFGIPDIFKFLDALKSGLHNFFNFIYFIHLSFGFFGGADFVRFTR